MQLEADGRCKVLWFSGLSGSGKSTLCRAAAEELRGHGWPVHILDGDDLRRGVCSDLGFEVHDRLENVRRIAHIANLLSQQGSIVLVAVICPLESLRQVVREIIPDVIQVFVDCPLAICEQRDPKGLYKKARAGLLPNFTGIGANFEPPAAPDVVCRTDQESVGDSVARVLNNLRAPVRDSASASPGLPTAPPFRSISVA